MERFPTKPHHLFVEGDRVDRLEVLEGPSGRRTWSDDTKARIVMESYAPGAKVCNVSRRHGMAPQHLSTWRGLARKGKLVLPMPDDGEDLFAPIEVLPEAALPSEAPPACGRVTRAIKTYCSAAGLWYLPCHGFTHKRH